MDLNEIRMQIDQLDQSILHLFEQRMELCQQVAAYKKAHHMEIFQEGREAVIMERIGKAAQPQFMHAAQTLFSTMLDLSKQLQTQMLTQEEPIPQFSIPQFSAAQKIGCQEWKAPIRNKLPSSYFRNGRSPFFQLLNLYSKQWKKAKSNMVFFPFTIAPLALSLQLMICYISILFILLR